MSRQIYLSKREVSLIIEALDILKVDYIETEHPDSDLIKNLEKKLMLMEYREGMKENEI